MPVRLDDDSEEINGLKINRQLVNDMHKSYMTNQVAPKLRFGQFTVKEVLQLFIDNGILAKGKFTPSELAALEEKGLKIIIGNHFDAITCPPNRSTANKEPTYRDKNTVILTNTWLDKTLSPGQDPKSKGKWTFLLNGNKLEGNPTNFISIAGAIQLQFLEDNGLDRSVICPPDCPGSLDTNDQYHEDI